MSRSRDEIHDDILSWPWIPWVRQMGCWYSGEKDVEEDGDRQGEEVLRPLEDEVELEDHRCEDLRQIQSWRILLSRTVAHQPQEVDRRTGWASRRTTTTRRPSYSRLHALPGADFTNIFWAAFFARKCFLQLFISHSLAL